jgi:hypothetical protein
VTLKQKIKNKVLKTTLLKDKIIPKELKIDLTVSSSAAAATAINARREGGNAFKMLRKNNL